MENQIVMTAEDEIAEEAAFMAGFDSPDTDEPVDAEDTTEPAEPAPDEPAKLEAPVEPELTVHDLKVMIDAERADKQKLQDRLFGKIGDLQQRIDTAKTKVSGFSPKAKERMAVEFPELAQMLFENDGEPEPEQQAYTPPAPQVDIQEIIRREVEPVKLAVMHQDWEQVVNSQEFSDWKQSQLAPKVMAELDSSWDAKVIAGHLSAFKTYRTAQQAKTATAQTKQARLDAAITPKGSPRSGSMSGSDEDEESAMMAAYGRK
jgi:hypothetical protein